MFIHHNVVKRSHAPSLVTVVRPQQDKRDICGHGDNVKMWTQPWEIGYCVDMSVSSYRNNNCCISKCEEQKNVRQHNSTQKGPLSSCCVKLSEMSVFSRNFFYYLFFYIVFLNNYCYLFPEIFYQTCSDWKMAWHELQQRKCQFWLQVKKKKEKETML